MRGWRGIRCSHHERYQLFCLMFVLVFVWCLLVSSQPRGASHVCSKFYGILQGSEISRIFDVLSNRRVSAPSPNHQQ
jgi:hypothetical protein